jgi:ABC-type transport system substrate-binding protein
MTPRQRSRPGRQESTWRSRTVADYPTLKIFYPPLHSANKGVGGNASTESAIRQAVSDARDEAKRVSMYRKVDQMAYNDAPMIYLFF